MDNLEGGMTKKQVIVFNLDKLNEEDFLNFVKEIKELDDSLVPEQMQFSLKELKNFFSNRKGVNLVVKNNDGKITGYLASVPHNEEIKNLKKYDSLFKEDNGALYIESLAVKKGDLGTFNNLLEKLIDEASPRYKKITMHARASEGNNLSHVLVERYHFKYLRTILNWYGYGEPFDYLEFYFLTEDVSKKS